MDRTQGGRRRGKAAWAAARRGLVLLAISAGGTALAQDDEDGRTTRITVHGIDLAPTDQAGFERSMARLSEAAMQACGAMSFEFGANRSAIAASPCWREAMRTATASLRQPASRVASNGMP